MTQNIIGVNNHTNTLGTRNSLQDFSTVFSRQFKTEGIIDGLTVKATSPNSPAIDVNKGSCAINTGDRLLFFKLEDDITNLAVPNTGSAKYYLVTLKINITDATQEITVEEGTAGVDPTLTEGGSPEVYYLVLARINKLATANVTDAEIEQDGVSITNNGDAEIIGRFAGDDGWTHTDEVWNFSTTSSFTIEGDKTSKYTPGQRIKFDQGQAYTNDPSTGSSVVLNITDTTGFLVGNEVIVSSSAGRETAVVESIVVNTSITLDSLSIDHTTTNPLVSVTKYYEIGSVSVTTNVTTITVATINDYVISNSTISNNFYSSAENPAGYREFVTTVVDTNEWMQRNAIVNGNFDFATNGTSFVDPSSGTETLDKWLVAFALGGGTNPTLTHSQAKLTPGTIDRSYFYYKLNTDGAGSGYGAGSYYLLYQLIDQGTRFLCGDGEKLTVSFWAKSNITGKKLGIYANQSYGTGGSPSSLETINGTNWTLSNTWTLYSHTFTTNTLTGKTFGTNDDDSFQFVFVPMWNTDIQAFVGDSGTESFVNAGDIEIKQVKMNAGDTVETFYNRHPKLEEALIKYEPFISTLTTKGDKLVHDGTSEARLPTGSNNQITMVDSGEVTGHKYVNYVASKGDLISHSGTLPTVQSVGANGSIYIADNTQTTGLRSIILPAFRAGASGSLSIPSSTTTQITYGTPSFDYGSGWNSGSNKYVVPYSGIYAINALVTWRDAYYNKQFESWIKINTAVVSHVKNNWDYGVTTHDSSQFLSTLQEVSSGDEIFVQVFHNHTSSVTVDNIDIFTYFEVYAHSLFV